MAKTSGLGDGLLIAGYDASGDIQQLGSIGGGPALLNMTGINKSAYERQGGLRSGQIEYTAFFNHVAVTGATHDKLAALPTTDQILTYCRGTTLGDPAASLVSKQINYDGTRGDDGMLTFAVSAQSNGYGIEWGRQLTAGVRTDTGATNGTAISLTGGDAYIQLAGASGDWVTTPDAASLDITGDIDIRVKVAADDWTPAATQCLIAKYLVTGSQRAYALNLATSGVLSFTWSTDGTTPITKNSTVSTGVTDGATKWVRATLDVDNGAAGNDVKFYTSDDGTTWTQLGATVTTAGTTSIFASTALLGVGARDASGVTDRFIGKFFEGVVMNGIAGTEVAHPVATVSSVTDATPLTWTLNGTALATNQTSHGGQAYVHVTAFTGTDVTVKIQDSADNSSFTDVASFAFTQVTTAPTSERIALANTATIRRYVRAITTTSGGFSLLSFAVNMIRNETAGQVF